MSADESYPGSKASEGVYQRIISLMPEHHDYFELFLGKGKIIRTKRLAPGRNVGADTDPAIFKWWSQRPQSPYLTILQEDALQILSSDKAMMDPTTLVYLDPPYLISTRTRKRYDHEFCTVDEHRALILAMKRCRCMIMISGYWSNLYETLLDGWRYASFRGMTRRGPKQEFVWMNFPAGLPLHDVRFVGTGFRERERIKRKRQRWVKRFEAMPLAERQVIREALEEVENPNDEIRNPNQIPITKSQIPPAVSTCGEQSRTVVEPMKSQISNPNDADLVVSPQMTMRSPSPEMTSAAAIAGNDDAAGTIAENDEGADQELSAEEELELAHEA